MASAVVDSGFDSSYSFLPSNSCDVCMFESELA